MAETFKQRDWRPGSLRFVAATITLSDPETARNSNYTTDPGSSPVLYLCDAGSAKTLKVTPGDVGAGLLYNVDADTKFYYPLIEDWQVDAGSTGFGDAIRHASCSMTIVNHRYVWQKIHATTAVETDNISVRLSQTMADYLWFNALITVKIATEQFNYVSDASAGVDYHEHKGQLIFTGRINSVRVDDGRIYVDAIEDLSWDKSFPDSERPTGGTGPSVINKVSYTTAPQSSVGAVIPMVFTSRGQLSRFTDEGAPTNVELVSPYNLDGLFPVAVTHYNSSTSVFLKLVSSKWCTGFGAAPATTHAKFYIDTGENRLAEYGSPASSTTELYENVAPGDYAAIGIQCDKYNGTHNGASNQANAVDGKFTTYATVAYSGSTGYLDLVLPTIANRGHIQTLQTYCVFQTDSVGGGATDATIAARFGLWNVTAGDWAFNTAGLGPATQNPKEYTKAQVNAFGNTIGFSSTWSTGATSWNSPDQPFSDWRWTVNSAGTQQDIVFRVQAVTSGTSLNIVAAGVYLVFSPSVATHFTNPNIIRTTRTMKDK